MKRLTDSVKFTRKLWGDLGEKLVKMLLIRTFTKGIGADGKRLKPYSELYKKFRRKKGRKTSPVTHTFSARFQKNLKRGRTTKKGTEYGWRSEGAKVEYAESNDRDILGADGVDKKEAKLIENTIGDFIDKKIKAFARQKTVVRVGR